MPGSEGQKFIVCNHMFFDRLRSCTSVMLHQLNHCRGIIPKQANVSVCNSLQCWALKLEMLLIP